MATESRDPESAVRRPNHGSGRCTWIEAFWRASPYAAGAASY